MGHYCEICLCLTFLLSLRTLLKISQLNCEECPAEKSPGISLKKMFEALVKKEFSRKFITVFCKKKKSGINLNLKVFSCKHIIRYCKKKKNKLKFRKKHFFAKGSNNFLREFSRDFTAGKSP